MSDAAGKKTEKNGKFSLKKLLLAVTTLSLILLICWFARYAVWVRQVNETMDSIWQGKFAKAKEQARQAVSLMSWFPDSKSFALSLRMITSIYACRRRFQQAEAYVQKLLDFDKRVWGEKSAEYAGDISELALMKRKQGKFVEAEKLYRLSISIYRACGKDHEADLARMQGLLAWVLIQERKTAEALALIEESDAIMLAKFGENHFERLLPLVERAYAFKKEGKMKEHRQDLDSCYKIISEPKAIENSSAQTVVVMNLLAQMLAEQNLDEKADKTFEIAENNCKSSVFGGGCDLYMADILDSHAKLLDKLSRQTAAAILRRRAEQIRNLSLS